MPFRRWDPFMDLLSIHREIFGESLDFGLMEARQGGWVPAVDIYETQNAYVIKAELPGVDFDQVKLECRQTRLVVAGQRPDHGRDQRRKYHHVERLYGPFERTFQLPEGVDMNKIEAHQDAGVLEILVPKTTKKEPRSIDVQTE